MEVVQLLKDEKRYYIITEVLEGGELYDLFNQKDSNFSEKDVQYIIK